MRSFLPIHIFGGIALFFAMAAPLPADIFNQGGGGEKKRTPEVTYVQDEPRIPTPVAQKVKVLLGGTLEIQLATLADGPLQRVNYVIREEPKAGALTPVETKQDNLAAGVLRYTPDPATQLTVDQFTFAASYPKGRVSAPVTVEIQLVRPKPVLELPPTVSFGRTMLGQKSTVQLAIANSGNAVFEGIPHVTPPWSWAPAEGEDAIRVEPGKQVLTAFTYTPTERGSSTFRLDLQPGVERGVTRFAGEGYVPFDIDTPVIALVYDPRTFQRLGKVEIRSADAKPVSVRVQGNERLLVSTGAVQLLKDAKAEVTLTLRGDPFAYEGEVEVSVPGYARIVKVTAAPCPAHIEPVTNQGSLVVDFGRVEPGQSAARTLILRNRGGVDGAVTLPLEAPFSLTEGKKDVTVPAASQVEVPLWFRPQEARNFTQTIPASVASKSIQVMGDASPALAARTPEFTTGRAMEAPATSGDPAAPRPSVAVRPYPGTSSSASGGGNPPVSVSPRSESYSEQMARDRALQKQPATLEELTRRDLMAKEIPSEVRGRNGEVALPPVLTRDGMMAYSPFKKKVDITLPHIPKFGVVEAAANSMKLVWRLPADGHKNFQVEVRATRYNQEKKRYECIWFPTEKVAYDIKDGFVYATVKGLTSDSPYLFRVFSMSKTGTHSLPSLEYGARTGLPEKGGIGAALFGLLLLVGAGALAWFFGQRIRLA